MQLQDWTPEEIMQKVAKGKQFTLLLLRPVAPLPNDPEKINQLQMGNLAHLFRMEEEGKSSLYGPVINNQMLNGIIVFNTINKEDIHQWTSDDPHIKAGYLTYDLYDWFTLPGQKIPE
ncbi:MAG: hypothetical protein ICV51_20245 [Flavisolibacter sp.]|nr:hypothetical protein [Flavisolibacter sp.]